METILDYIEPSELKELPEDGLPVIVSFKEWVDAKYQDTNLITRYESVEEVMEFLTEVVKTSMKFRTAIIPVFERDFKPEADLTSSIMDGSILHDQYVTNNGNYKAYEMIANTIEFELLTGHVPFKYIDLTQIIKG